MNTPDPISLADAMIILSVVASALVSSFVVLCVIFSWRKPTIRSRRNRPTKSTNRRPVSFMKSLFAILWRTAAILAIGAAATTLTAITLRADEITYSYTGNIFTLCGGTTPGSGGANLCANGPSDPTFMKIQFQLANPLAADLGATQLTPDTWSMTLIDADTNHALLSFSNTSPGASGALPYPTLDVTTDSSGIINGFEFFATSGNTNGASFLYSASSDNNVNMGAIWNNIIGAPAGNQLFNLSSTGNVDMAWNAFNGAYTGSLNGPYQDLGEAVGAGPGAWQVSSASQVTTPEPLMDAFILFGVLGAAVVYKRKGSDTKRRAPAPGTPAPKPPKALARAHGSCCSGGRCRAWDALLG